MRVFKCDYIFFNGIEFCIYRAKSERICVHSKFLFLNRILIEFKEFYPNKIQLSFRTDFPFFPR